MKKLICLILIAFSSTHLLFAQTRFYHAAYSNAFFSIAGRSSTLEEGNHGLVIGTSKFRNNTVMRSLSFSYVVSKVPYSQSIQSKAGGDYVKIESRMVYSKYTMLIENLRLIGKKEMDDPSVFYFTFGYFFQIISSNYEVLSDQQTINSAQYKPSDPFIKYVPYDLGFKFGVGYQHMIGNQFAAFGEVKILEGFMNEQTVLDYNIGVRYRPLAKH